MHFMFKTEQEHLLYLLVPFLIWMAYLNPWIFLIQNLVLIDLKIIFCLCCLPIVVMFGLVNAPGIEVLYLDPSMIMHQITKTASVYSDAI